MANIIKIKEQDEKIEYGGFLDGDFNSNASTQSWGEFFTTWAIYGAGPAIVNELSSWHGEVETKKYNTPYKIMFGGGKTFELPVTYDVSLIRSGMKSSDFMENVKSDEKGEFYEYGDGGQKIKLYLPNNNFFSKYVGLPFKFETETGDVYSLFLSLKSDRSTQELQLGADTSNDSISISMKGENGDNGNGWFFKAPPDITGVGSEYYKKVGNELISFDLNILSQSVKSSFELWWDKWGVVAQIVGSIVMAYFTAGLSTGIQAIFASSRFIAIAGETSSSAILTWLGAEGAFSVTRSTVLAMFLLETSINLPAAFIDKSFGNDFGFVIGIAFCFFPIISNYGRIGKFIKGKYSQEAAQSLAQKVLFAGLTSATSKEAMYKFITEQLTAEEKVMWAEMMKLFSTKEGATALEESLKEVFEKAAKNGEIMSKFKSMIKGGTLGQGLRQFLTAIVFFVDVSKWYLIVNKIKEIQKDPRSVDDIFINAQDNVDKKIKPKFKVSDSPEIKKSINVPSTDEILKKYLSTKSEDEGGDEILKLSKSDNDLTYFQTIIAQEKIKWLKENLKFVKDLNEKTKEILSVVTEVNNTLNDKVTPEEVISWVDIDENDQEFINALSSLSNDPMSVELKEVITTHKCLATNFKYLDGIDLPDGYTLNFKVIKPITIKYDNGQSMNLKINDTIWIFKNSSFLSKGKEYTNFKCN